MKPLGGGQIKSIDKALRFIIEHYISTAIPGMDKVEQIRQNLQAARNFKPLTPEERQCLAAEARTIGGNFCQRCGACEKRCPYDLPVAADFG